MKRSRLFRLAFVALVAMTIQKADAGSAVGTDAHGHNVYVCGHPAAICKQLVLDEARRRGWANVRIVAATDVTGYGAIAVALHPNGHGSILGGALGKRSASEAYIIAIQECVKSGGTHARVKWTFRG